MAVVIRFYGVVAVYLHFTQATVRAFLPFTVEEHSIKDSSIKKLEVDRRKLIFRGFR